MKFKSLLLVSLFLGLSAVSLKAQAQVTLPSINLGFKCNR